MNYDELLNQDLINLSIRYQFIEKKTINDPKTHIDTHQNNVEKPISIVI